MKKNRRNKKPGRLTEGMIKVILICWIIPYIVLSAVLIRVSVVRNSIQVKNTLQSSVESAGRIVTENIENAIGDSRQASYDGVVKKAYETFLKDGDEDAMHRTVTDYLNRTYKFSRTVSSTILLYGDDVKMEYYTYSNAAGATYASIGEFRRDAEEAVRLEAENLDTKTKLMCLSGHMYVVRNIVLSSYEPFATLVMELNRDRLFEAMNNVIWKTDGIVLLDGAVVYDPSGESPDGRLLETISEAEEKTDPPREGSMVFYYKAGGDTACLEMKINGQRYAFAAGLDRRAMLSDRMAVIFVYTAVFVMLIPLLIATFYFFYTNINRPILSLAEGAEKIRGGQYGYQVEPFRGNQEIGQLIDDFNHMSGSLDESFRRIYAEEVAGRDAALKALQSQINPHFLNNTLEIINWKARMNGNDDVSEMISALSVMMNAALNRNNEMFITLEEELTYVDAYLYIIKERFGERFSFTEEVDSSLLDLYVPRLIIQPIIENAVEHGGDGSGSRTGSLRIFGNREELHIAVENNGTLSPEDKEKIAALLSDAEQIPGGEKADSASIGIRNVHRRLRMIYGSASGLTIRDTDEGSTVSELVICRETETPA